MSLLNSRFLRLSMAIARRNVRSAVRNPALWAPPLAFPLFSLAALAGGLSGITALPGFDYDGGYTAFQFAFSVVQVACFGGVFLGLAVAEDFDSGFMRRFMLASQSRVAILVGYTVAALVRFAATVLIVFGVAVAAGMQILGGWPELLNLLALGLLVNAASFLFAAGVAMRIRSLDAGGFMLMPIFTMLFLAPVYVPVNLLSGWLKATASVNPVTAFLEGARNMLVGSPEGVLSALVLAGAITVVLCVSALRGLRIAAASSS